MMPAHCQIAYKTEQAPLTFGSASVANLSLPGCNIPSQMASHGSDALCLVNYKNIT